MRRVQEVIYVVPEEREEFLKKQLNPSVKTGKFLWHHGIRNQFFYELEDFILMTFEYVGDNYEEDMKKLAADEENKRWLTFTDPCQEPVETAGEQEWWAPMENIFHIL